MHLAIDVGNTAVKFGWQGPLDHEVHRCEPIPSAEFDQAACERRLDAIGEKPSFCAIASVVPNLNEVLALALERCGLPFRFLNSTSVPGLDNRYETPETLGADRLANALALARSGRLPAIAVDFGTATKLDAVDSSGAFLGGAILPSPSMMLRALGEGTAQLPIFDLSAPPRALGRSTQECLRSGTILAHAKAVEGLLDDFQRELGSLVAIVATGGAAASSLSLCPNLETYDPDLTLRGLLIAARLWTEGC